MLNKMREKLNLRGKSPKTTEAPQNNNDEQSEASGPELSPRELKLQEYGLPVYKTKKLPITDTAMEQANIEDLRNLLKDLIEMREEQRTVQATIAELRSMEASEKRNEAMQCQELRAKLVDTRDNNTELKKISELACAAELVSTNVISYQGLTDAAHFALTKSLQNAEDNQYNAHWETQHAQLLNVRAKLNLNIYRTLHNEMFSRFVEYGQAVDYCRDGTFSGGAGASCRAIQKLWHHQQSTTVGRLLKAPQGADLGCDLVTYVVRFASVMVSLNREQVPMKRIKWSKLKRVNLAINSVKEVPSSLIETNSSDTAVSIELSKQDKEVPSKILEPEMMETIGSAPSGGTQPMMSDSEGEDGCDDLDDSCFPNFTKDF